MITRQRCFPKLLSEAECGGERDNEKQGQKDSWTEGWILMVM